ASERRQSIDQIERAIRAEQLPEAESIFYSFEAKFPGDPASNSLRDRIAESRRALVEKLLAELEAARQVTDPARMLELFTSVAPSLESDAREVLERDLSGWFLQLIHRRLRTGKIQAEVVALATQVADTFKTTVEGASLRAALPTLRRSVGMCPRCGQ